METFWFFRLRFRRAYDSAYDSDIRFLLGHKLSYDSDYDYDSIASENQPLEDTTLKAIFKTVALPALCDVVSSVSQLFVPQFAMSAFTSTEFIYNIA